ncbi:mucin-6-like [Carassius gibelio]|uniref:mucin-6-like n=1 Tax=Carassius gibelio TaxID=101364 RepID=UPI0022783573|nr:mucin-6-like [Carassius gibelio]
MELFRPCLFFYLLAILLSLSISLTTNSNPTTAETLQWKGGDGVKRSRVRRQNLDLQNALRLPEKAYAFFMLWRILDEMYNDANTIKPLMTMPDKLEFTTPEGPKIMETEVKTSSVHVQEQSIHSTGMTGTNNSTAMPSFPTHSLPDSQKTTQLEDLQLVGQSTQRLQTTIQKITEFNQATEQHIPDSTTFKILTIASEETSTIAIHEQIDHFTGINIINNSTAMVSFPTHSSFPDSQETTQSGDSKLAKESTQQLQITIQKITEFNQAIEQHIPDSKTFEMSTTTSEEPSTIAIHEQIDHFTGINSINISTAMASFPTHSFLSETTQSGETTQSDSQLAEESTQRLQTTIQKITEFNQAKEQHIPDSTTFKFPTTASEEPSTIAIHEQIDHLTGINGINNSTAMDTLPTQSSFPDSQETTQSGDSELAEESTQRPQTTIQNIPSIHEQIDHFTGINSINNSTSMASFPTHSSLPDSQETTQSRDSQLAEESTQQPQTTIQNIPSIHEQINRFTGINGINNSTVMASLPTQSSFPDSQETTKSGDSQLAEESTQRFKTTIQKITQPSEVTEQHIPDSSTFKFPTTAAEDPSTIAIHEQIDHLTGINDTNNSTAMASFPTHSSLPDSQETTQSRDSQLAEESTQQPQTTIQNIPSIHEQIDHFTGINGINNSTAMASLPTQSSFPDSQETTQSRDSQLAEESTQRLQTTIQKITQPSEVTEQHILDSTTFKFPTTAAEDPSTTAIHEQIYHLTGINGINNSTAMASLHTQSSLPDTLETTQSGDSNLAKESTQQLQTTMQNIPSIHEQIDHFTGINGINNSTAMASLPTQSSFPDSQETTKSGDSQLAEESTQRFKTTIQKITQPSEVTEQHIPDSSTFKFPTTAAEDPSTIAIHEQIDHLTGINDTNNSTAMASFPTHSSLPDSQETTQSGDSQLAEESTQQPQTTIQNIPSIHEQIDHFTGINGINNSTAMASLPTQSSFPDSQETTQSRDSQLAEESTQQPQTTIQKIPSIHEQIDHFTGINGINNSTAMASLPTQSSFPDSQETTQSGDSQLAEESTQRLQTTIQKITQPSEVTEQHIPDSSTFKFPTTAAEVPSTIAIHEQIDHLTGINGINNSTAMASLHTQSSLPDTLETTQSGDSNLAKESTQQLQTTIQNIPSILEQIDYFTGINDTNNFTSKASFPTHSSLPDSQETTQSGDSQLAEESTKFLTTIQKNHSIHEQIDHFTGSNGTKNYTAMVSLPTQSSFPDSQETTESGDLQLAEQSTQRLQTTIQNIIEPSQVTEQHIPDSTKFTIKNSSKAAEEPSSIAVHDQINRFTGINGINNSTAMESLPTQSSFPDSQETTQSGDSELAEESAQHFHRTKQKIPKPIIHSTGTNGTNYSTPTSFLTELPPQVSQENTLSGAPQLLEHSTQHFQSPKQKMTKPSLKIVHLIATISTPHLATTYRIQQETLLKSAMDPHIPNNDILASTMENDNLQPTPVPQITKDEYPNMTPFIMQSISKPTPPARTKQTTLLTVKPEIIKHPPHTLSVTWQNGKPNWLVTTTDWRVSKPTPPTFTLKRQIQDSTSLLLTPKNIKKNTQTRTNDSLVSSKTASTSPLPILIEKHLFDSEGPKETSVPTGISLQDSRTHRSNAETQSQSTTNKYTILNKIMSQTSFPLVKDTANQAPTDGVHMSQTIPVTTEKLIKMFTLNPRPSEKNIHTTSVVTNGLLQSRTLEIPSRISTKRANIHPTKTTESRYEPTNQGPTADSMPNENYSNNDLLTEMEKPTQSMSGRKPSLTTRSTRWHVSKTQTISQKPKTFILSTYKSANSAVENDTKTHRYIFEVLLAFMCLLLLLIVILLWVVWKRWKARHRRSNIWVAGSPVLCGTYHSVLQYSSSHGNADEE